jgi:hypothetical protein
MPGLLVPPGRSALTTIQTTPNAKTAIERTNWLLGFFGNMLAPGEKMLPRHRGAEIKLRAGVKFDVHQVLAAMF